MYFGIHISNTSWPFLEDRELQSYLSQDLETWYSKLAIVKFWGVLFFKRDHSILQIYTINMYIPDEIKKFVHIKTPWELY